MKHIILFLAALPAFAQIRVTFSQQGAEVLSSASGKRIKGMGIAAVTAKNLGPAAIIQADDIYAAAAKIKISYIAPALAGPILEKHAAASLPQIALDVTGITTGGIGLAGISRAIKMSNGWALGLSAVPVLISLGQRFFTSQLPRPDLVKEHLLTGSWKLEQGEYIPSGQLIVFRYHGDWDPREVDIGGLVAAQPAPKPTAQLEPPPDVSALPLINVSSTLWEF